MQSHPHSRVEQPIAPKSGTIGATHASAHTNYGTTRMSNTMKRRAFLAAGALSIPSIALAKGIGLGSTTSLDGPFEDYMKQADNHLRTMRGLMRALDRPGARDDAAFYANQITILLAQCVQHAEDLKVPEPLKAKYAEDEAQFTKDMRIKLTESVSAANALARQLMLGNDTESSRLYSSLRTSRKEGHDEFKVDD